MKQMNELCLVILLGFCPNLMAETYVKIADVPYDAEGIIYDLQQENGSINIGDEIFFIPENLRINLLNGKSVSGVENLNTGTPIGYTFQGKVISEIWELDREPKYVRGSREQ